MTEIAVAAILYPIMQKSYFHLPLRLFQCNVPKLSRSVTPTGIRVLSTEVYMLYTILYNNTA